MSGDRSAFHRFGGTWTEDKLLRIDKYLRAYMTIFRANPAAANLTTNYVDAFAGTGRRMSPVAEDRAEGTLFEDALTSPDADSLKEGSAYVALDQDQPFDQYLFIDRHPEHAGALEGLREEFPELADRIRIETADANTFLVRWCHETDWTRNRAVVFLDPYGMQVDWTTIETLAGTRAVDLWILFPLGQAVNRLLTRRSLPTGAHARRLTRLFGTDAWRDAFYAATDEPSDQQTIFDVPGVSDEGVAKQANFRAIGNFFVERLREVFAGVAENPRPLTNSKNVPLYLLCFAAANPRGARTAIKISQDILRA